MKFNIEFEINDFDINHILENIFKLNTNEYIIETKEIDGKIIVKTREFINDGNDEKIRKYEINKNIIFNEYMKNVGVYEYTGDYGYEIVIDTEKPMGCYEKTGNFKEFLDNLINTVIDGKTWNCGYIE